MIVDASMSITCANIDFLENVLSLECDIFAWVRIRSVILLNINEAELKTTTPQTFSHKSSYGYYVHPLYYERKSNNLLDWRLLHDSNKVSKEWIRTNLITDESLVHVNNRDSRTT